MSGREAPQSQMSTAATSNNVPGIDFWLSVGGVSQGIDGENCHAKLASAQSFCCEGVESELHRLRGR